MMLVYVRAGAGRILLFSLAEFHNPLPFLQLVRSSRRCAVSMVRIADVAALSEVRRWHRARQAQELRPGAQSKATSQLYEASVIESSTTSLPSMCVRVGWR